MCLPMISLLLHNLIKEKCTVLIEQNFNSEGFHHLAHNEKHALFSLWNNQKDIIYGPVRKFVMLSIIFQ